MDGSKSLLKSSDILGHKTKDDPLSLAQIL